MKRNSLSGALILGALALVTTLVAPAASAQQTGYSFVPLTPCRLIDTRGPNATNGGPVMSAGAIRAFQVRLDFYSSRAFLVPRDSQVTH